MSASALILASDIITDPVEKQEFGAAATDASLLYNHCKRCGRKIKAPQEYGRVCAGKMRVVEAAGASESADKTNASTTGITRREPGDRADRPARIFGCQHIRVPPQPTSTSELIAKVKEKTASEGMCWACQKLVQCNPQEPAVVCTTFRGIYHLRRIP